MKVTTPPDEPPIISLDDYKIERGIGSPHCWHKPIIVDENRRTVACKPCGAVLDAFDELVKLARARQNLRWQEKELRNNIAKLKAEHEELKRLVGNGRARKRRKGDKPELKSIPRT